MSSREISISMPSPHELRGGAQRAQPAYSFWRRVRLVLASAPPRKTGSVYPRTLGREGPPLEG